MNSSARLDPLRLVLGFLLTPAITPILAVVAAYVVTEEHNGECPFGYMVLFAIFYGLPLSYICAVVLGIPYVLVLQEIGHLNFWTIMAGAYGVWVGATALLLRPQPGLFTLQAAVVIASLVGMLLAGALFYLVAVRGNFRLLS